MKSSRVFLYGNQLITKITQTAVINIVFQRIFIKLDVSYTSHLITILKTHTRLVHSVRFCLRVRNVSITAQNVQGIVRNIGGEIRWTFRRYRYSSVFYVTLGTSESLYPGLRIPAQGKNRSRLFTGLLGESLLLVDSLLQTCVARGNF